MELLFKSQLSNIWWYWKNQWEKNHQCSYYQKQLLAPGLIWNEFISVSSPPFNVWLYEMCERPLQFVFIHVINNDSDTQTTRSALNRTKPAKTCRVCDSEMTSLRTARVKSRLDVFLPCVFVWSLILPVCLSLCSSLQEGFVIPDADEQEEF